MRPAVRRLSFCTASEQDRATIARLLVSAFARDFDAVGSTPAQSAQAIADGLQLEYFTVARLSQSGEIAGIAACSGEPGDAMVVDRRAMVDWLGWLRGRRCARLLLGGRHSTPAQPVHTGYIEFVAVETAFRQQEIATALLRYIVEHTPYDRYVLEVAAANTAAINCYLRFGFSEYERYECKRPFLRAGRPAARRICMQYISK